MRKLSASSKLWVCADCHPEQHDSDCATNNEPAMPNGLCDCSLERNPPEMTK